MSILFGSGQYLSRTTNLPPAGHTVCWWSYQTSDLNTFTPQLMLWETGGEPQYIQCGSTSDGTSFVIEVNQADTGSWVDTGVLLSASLNTWYFWAWTLNSYSGAFTANGYVSAAGSDTFSTGSVGGTWPPGAGGGAFAPNNFEVAHDAYGGRFAGRIAGVKIFPSVLTADQIRAEKRQLEPVHLGLVREHYRLEDPTRIFDYGPNGYNWSLTGTPSAAEGPPVPLRVRRRSYFGGWSAAAGGGGGLSIPIAMRHYLRQMGAG